MTLESRLAELSKIADAASPVVTVYLDTRRTDEHRRDQVRVFMGNEVRRARAGARSPASIWIFRVRFIGSVAIVSAGALLFSICTIGIGLVISALTRTQLAAMMATFLGAVAPAFTFSGVFAPVASDPVSQLVSRLIPATYFMDVVRGNFLKGGARAVPGTAV